MQHGCVNRNRETPSRPSEEEEEEEEEADH